mgnify:FL=1
MDIFFEIVNLAAKNHLLGLISLQNTYYLCVGLFIIGVIIYIFTTIKE